MCTYIHIHTPLSVCMNECILYIVIHMYQYFQVGTYVPVFPGWIGTYIHVFQSENSATGMRIHFYECDTL